MSDEPDGRHLTAADELIDEVKDASDLHTPVWEWESKMYPRHPDEWWRPPDDGEAWKRRLP